MSSFRENGGSIACFPNCHKQSDAHKTLGIPIALLKATMPHSQRQLAQHLRRQLANSAVLFINYETCSAQATAEDSTQLQLMAQTLSADMKKVFNRISEWLVLAGENPLSRIEDLIPQAGIKLCPQHTSLDSLWLSPSFNSIPAIDEIGRILELQMPMSNQQPSLALLSSILKTHFDHVWCLRNLAEHSMPQNVKTFTHQSQLVPLSM
jgi:DNA-binding ferritin-like protein